MYCRVHIFPISRFPSPVCFHLLHIFLTGTTGCFKLAREYLDGFNVPFEVVGGNHDLEGIDEFPTDESNMDAYLSILNKPTPQFIREIAPKTLLIGESNTVSIPYTRVLHLTVLYHDLCVCRPWLCFVQRCRVHVP